MNMTISAEGRAKLTEPWEECVLYVYDDKVAPRLIDGKRQYVEWDGGAVRGTLTIGWGHTDAAGPIRIAGVSPKIVKGLRITAEQADQILDDDLAPCVAAVNRAIKVPVTQHQADALYDLDFNCPSAIPHVSSLVNTGDWPGAERVMLQYVNSQGERMQGLVNRRNAEIRWANLPDDKPSPAVTVPGDDDLSNFSPKAERATPPKTMATSKTGASAVTIGAGGVVATVQAVNDAAEPLKQAKQNLQDLGLVDWALVALHNPAILVGIAIVALAVFVWLDRRSKLVNAHV